MKLRLFILILLTFGLMIGNLFFGAVSIPAGEIMDVLSGKASEDDVIRFIVIENRLAQSITALLAGAALAVSGLMLQTVFRNPLAGPSILGITSGGSLGVALVVLLFGGSFTIGEQNLSGDIALTTGAMAGSFLVMAVLIGLSIRIRNNLMLLIIGMMTGYIASSTVTLLASISDAKTLQNYVMWGMGTFASVTLDGLTWFAPTITVGLIIAMMLVKPLNLLLLGDNYATNLGINISRVRRLLLIATGLLTAIVTAYCGPIAFIGLAMPHIARMIFRTDNHLVLMPATMLCGAILALSCTLLSVLPEGSIIPINALTPIAGVPVILYVILRGTKRR